MRTRVAILGLALAGALSSQTPTASELYVRGRRAERSGHMAEAYLLYSQAAAMSPNTKTYWQRAKALQTRAALDAKALPPATIEAGPAATEPATEEPAP